ncbi:MAG: hypothetical protein ACW98Y_12075, partial [Candidatus Thorarchaeota archaeon]
MNTIESLNEENIENCLEKLDRWTDAVKDIVLVSIGIIASYISLSLGSSIEVILILVILAVSILSSIFLPYKIAAVKSSKLGVFSRYRAIELMIVIVISWIIPTGLIFLIPEILEYLVPVESLFISTLLLIGIPYLSMIIAGLFCIVVLVGIFKRIGLEKDFFETFKKFQWGLPGIALMVVSQTVVQVELRLLRAFQVYNTSIETATEMYSQAFGTLIVMILLCC